ncbi:MAG: sulfotransferase family protein [Acidimicrobiales bacterium]
MNGEAPFLFIVGCRRSGTTLLRTIFDSHPAMAVSHEAHFVAPMGARRRRYHKPDGLDVEGLIDDLMADSEFPRMDLDAPSLRDALNLAGVRTYPDAVRCIFSLYAHRQGKDRYGDKMPGYVLRLPLLARLFPEARFVHVIRDGRDVCLSLTELWFKDRGLGEAALFWKRRVVVGRRAGRRLGPHRYREVRYEDLVDDPVGTVKSLCHFLDLEPDEGMLLYPERGEDVARATGYPELHPRLSLPPTKGLRDWRRDMTSSDQVLFETLAGGLLGELGYERTLTRSPLRTRLGGAWWWLRWQGRRGAFHGSRLARRTTQRARLTLPGLGRRDPASPRPPGRS